MFRTPLCPSSGASQLHMQSLVSINYKNTCCLQICHYVHFIVTTNYLYGTYNRFLTSMFVLCCFVLGCGSVGFVSCIILLITYRLVLGSLCPPVLLCCNCCFFVCLWVSVFATQIICSNYKMYITTYL